MSSIAVSTYALTYNTTHTVTYVTSKMLLILKEIIREIGLDPGKLTDESAARAWLRSRRSIIDKQESALAVALAVYRLWQNLA